MDKPADPATPFGEVYQSFFDDLALKGTKPTTIARYRYDIVRFERWLVETGHPTTLASLERTSPHRLPAAPRDAGTAAARVDPAAPRRADGRRFAGPALALEAGAVPRAVAEPDASWRGVNAPWAPAGP